MAVDRPHPKKVANSSYAAVNAIFSPFAPYLAQT